MVKPAPTDPLLTTAEAAAYLGRPIGTMRQWRHKALGPRCFRMLGTVMYRQSVLENWLADVEAAETRWDTSKLVSTDSVPATVT